MRDYISLFHKLLSVHSRMFMSELYFCLFILHSVHTGINPCTDTSEILQVQALLCYY